MKRSYSRTQNTVFNLNANLVTMLVTQILGFVSRTIFIYILGVSYLGINGLYSNILSMLSLAELGVGTAIVYSLYKPLANKDNEMISALMSLYRKAYRTIGCIIMVAGLVLLFFLESLVNDVSSIDHYRLYYVLFLFNTVSTYFLAYKETLVNTDQRGYLLTTRNLAFQILTTMSQLCVLAITKNYAFYLITQIFVQTLRKIVVNIYINKLYPEIDFKSNVKVPQENKKEILKNVGAMFFQKIGGYVVFGTDNILIAKFVDLATVGIYSNYTMIINIIYSFVSIPFSAITSSIGNLTATDKTQEYKIYQMLFFINYLFASFTSICLYFLFNPFISIWIGKQYILANAAVFFVVFNYYMTTMRKSTELFYNANGLFWYSRYKSLVEAMINLIVSVILAYKLGILGILIGTSVSSVCTSVLYDVYILYRFGFNKSSQEYMHKYILNYLRYLLLTLIVGLISKLILDIVGYSNLFILCIDGIICFFIFLVTNYVVFRNTESFNEMMTKIRYIMRIYLKK